MACSNPFSKACVWSLLVFSLSLSITSSFANNEAIERITTTATRVASDYQSLPVAVSVIDNSQLNRISHAHIQQSISTIAGANFHRGNGQEYLPALRSPVLSGAGACGGILTLEDGIPLRAAGFCNINELFEAHSEIAERIEVLKGPGTAFYGSNAIHGVVNVITRDPIDNDGWLAGELGSYGYARAKLSTGSQIGNGGVGMNLSVARDDGYRDDEGFNQEKLTLRGSYLSGDFKVTTGLTYAHLDQQTAGFITGFEAYKDEQLARRNNDPEAFRDAQALRVWSRFEWQLSVEQSLTVTPYLRVQSMDFRMHFLPGDPFEENAQNGFGILSSWRQSLTDELTLITGIDAEITDGELRQYQPSPSQGSAFLQETVPQGEHYDYQVDATMIAPYTHLEWQSGDWLISGGLRYEYMRYDYTNLMLDGRTRDDGTACGFGGCRYSRPPSDTNQFENLSPKLGVNYQVSDGLNIYANLSRGFRAPQATELYRLQRDQQVADLQSEQADNIEIGVKVARLDSVYTLSAYHMDKDNFIFRDSDFFNVSDGRSRHQGIELEAWQRLNAHWQFSLAASYARHTYRYDQLLGDVNINGNDMDSAPHWFSNAQLTWLPTDNWRLDLQWQHMGDYYTDAENLHQYEGHDLANLYASYNFSDDLLLRMRVTNLTDEAYAERADYTSFSGDRYFPGRPRQYSVGVEVYF